MPAEPARRDARRALQAAWLAAGPACAASPALAAAPAAGADFFDAWRQAVARPAAEAIADLCAWPFPFEGRPLQHQAFMAQAVPAWLTSAVRRCMHRAVPAAEDGRQLILCKPYGFVLAPIPAGWRRVESFADAP
jgi:hypothetical protein